MSELRDTNVHQHLLRSLRYCAAEALGANLNGNEPTPASIMYTAVSAATDDLELLIQLLEKQNGLNPLVTFAESIRRRLNLASMLGEGCFDPDRPYVTASAIEYHPDGMKAGIKAAQAESAGIEATLAPPPKKSRLSLVNRSKPPP